MKGIEEGASARWQGRFSALIRGASPALLGGLLHAGLSASSLPGLLPTPWGMVAAFLALLPLVWIGQSEGRSNAVFLGVWLGQLPLWALQQWWVLDVSRFGFFPLIAVQSAWVPLFVVIAQKLCRRSPTPAPITMAVLWTGVEFLRGRVFLNGYAWGLSGEALIDSWVLASPGRVGGLYFVGFLMMLSAAGAWRLVGAVPATIAQEFRGTARTIGAVSVVFAATVWFMSVMAAMAGRSVPTRSVHVGVVQTNLPQSNKIGWSIEDEVRDFRRFAGLTRSAAQPDGAGKRPGLIVWPETMMPGLSLSPQAVSALRDAGVILRVDRGVVGNGEGQLPATIFAEDLGVLQAELGIPMLIGEEAIENLRITERADRSLDFQHDARFNSVFLEIGGATSPVRYDKIHLTPFGEVMPVISRWEWLEQQLLSVAAGGMLFDLEQGRDLTVFEVPAEDGTVRIVTPICFEATDATLCRRLLFERAGRRADLVVNVTNDGWFGASDLARRQHLRSARWRAFEFATPVVRAANTGISAVIDANGVVIAQGVNEQGGGGSGGSGCAGRGGARVEGVLRADAPLAVAGRTLYGYAGDWAGWMCFCISTIACAAGMWTTWRAHRSGRAAGPSAVR